MASYTLIGDFGRYDGQLVLDRPYVLPGDGYPAAMLVEDEVVLLRGGAGSEIVSVDRGQQGTDSADHASGTVIADISPYESTASGIVPSTVTLSSADILDLHNTPITLVAAPGAGKWLLVHRVGSYFTYGTVAYAGVDPFVYIEHAGTSTSTVSIATDPVTDRIEAPVVPTTFTVAPASDRVNKALVAMAFDPMTDGDGTLTVTVWYSIEDVPA